MCGRGGGSSPGSLAATVARSHPASVQPSPLPDRHLVASAATPSRCRRPASAAARRTGGRPPTANAHGIELESGQGWFRSTQSFGENTGDLHVLSLAGHRSMAKDMNGREHGQIYPFI